VLKGFGALPPDLDLVIEEEVRIAIVVDLRGIDLLAQVVITKLHLSQLFALQKKQSVEFLFVGHRICQKNKRRMHQLTRQSKCKF
jgi:hypothetical protein